MKTCTVVVCKKCQRIKRFLEWKQFGDLDQVDKDIYTRMAADQKLEVLFSLCPICSPPGLTAAEIIY